MRAVRRHGRPLTFLRLSLKNFLSYRTGVLDFGDLVALVGPNASGKSNAVAAIKLLREIPIHGLPTAIARRGGFDQLRHRSSGHPYDPAIRLEFKFDEQPVSYYELRLRAMAGKRYEVKLEQAEVYYGGKKYFFRHSDGEFLWADHLDDEEADELIPHAGLEAVRVPPGQSVVSLGGPSFATYLVSTVLQEVQTVEINPARVAELQEPSSVREFEPDGSNTASVFESLTAPARKEVIDELSAIVPGITRIDVRRFADKLTFSFYQETRTGRREFLAKQMSDGTLRAFSILLAMLQPDRPELLVIEEPEIAIHLGALRTLVDIFKQQSEQTQLLITTHSADIVDSLDIDSLRVVWSNDGASRISRVAPHTLEPVRQGLITPGELLRSDSLDPVA